MNWIWIVLGVLYIISPYDLIPDFIPVRGWIDDFIVAILLFRYIRRGLAHRRSAGRREGPQAEDRTDSARSGNRSKSPYDVLGVSPGASREQIQKAYRSLVNQYHPDKVAHLGREFQDMAEERFKEIQQAYQQLNKP